MTSGQTYDRYRTCPACQGETTIPSAPSGAPVVCPTCQGDGLIPK